MFVSLLLYVSLGSMEEGSFQGTVTCAAAQVLIEALVCGYTQLMISTLGRVDWVDCMQGAW